MLKQIIFNEYIIISSGSIIGALIRWQIDDIFIVNILGCFILGFINKLYLNPKLKLLIGFSFCGSLTTFSSWISDLFILLQNSFYIVFISNIFSFLIAGYISLYLGYISGKKLNELISFK